MKLDYIEDVDPLNRRVFSVLIIGFSAPFKAEVVIYTEQARDTTRHKWRRSKIWTSRSGSMVDMRVVPRSEHCAAPTMTKELAASIRKAICDAIDPITVGNANG